MGPRVERSLQAPRVAYTVNLPPLKTTMFAPSPSPAFPPADALFKALGSVNYKLLAIKLILLAATVAAVAVAVSTFVYRNARAFWAAHGETILFNAALFAEWLVKAAKATYQAAVAFQPVVARWANVAADRVFYQLAD